MVTAGNSYGQMDGGVDRALADHWPTVQRAVWAALLAVSNRLAPITAIAAPGFGTAQLMSAAHTMHRLPATTRISEREQLL